MADGDNYEWICSQQLSGLQFPAIAFCYLELDLGPQLVY